MVGAREWGRRRGRARGATAIGAAALALAALAGPAAAATPGAAAPASTRATPSASVPQLPLRAPDYPKVAVQRDVVITASDGTTLMADVYRPADASGTAVAKRLPVVVTGTPYNKNVLGAAGEQVATLAGASPVIVRRGYVQVVFDVRGTGSSRGTWRSFDPREQQDTIEVLAWARKQPWSDGDLAMTGASYMGINQLLAASRRPPGLKAIFPIIPGGDLYRDVVWHGGSVDLGFIPLWLGLTTALGVVPPSDAFNDPVRALGWLTDRLLTSAAFPLQAVLEGLTGGPLADDGDFYRVRSPLSVVDRIEVPTFISGGWWDLFQRGEQLLYQRLRLEPGRKQLLMGPWYHVTAGEGLGDGSGRPQPLTELAVLWFDRWIRGADNGIDRDFGPVTVNQLGPDSWRRERAWPPPGTRYQRLYLNAQASGLGGEDASLAWSRPTAAGGRTVWPNLLGSLCSRSTVQWTAGLLVSALDGCAQSNASAESGGATFTTAPQAKPLRVAGPIALRLRGSSSRADGFWHAQLTDVAPDGTSRALTSGFLAMGQRALDESRSERAANGDLKLPFHPFTKETRLPVTPDQPVDMDVEIFGTDAVIRPGHRLRLALTSSDLPHALPALPDLVGQVLAVQRVDIRPESPSFLSLPVVGPAPAATPPTATGPKRCRSQRRFRIRVRPGKQRIRSVRARVGGRSVKARKPSRRGRPWTVVVDLRRFTTKRTVRVTTTAKLANGRTVRDVRRYRTCTR
ncbi:CocE/NonD family hydrolase [Patulibacter defluvii]|uniref:CocE/NonD family hydrolase n=1 Tax=Patulibacter defluvii TaxID=3095358 RepID=UPI002A74B71E|nr:CocE/NonD family hydrolase [Patulibacter sp. DM4]